ncbi:diguanylate cyclase [Marinobacter sp.]|uniref:sensor domain-containing diguanylate cyclase n=1 Tax=Marinobacter sp. TaxID=50741 RepID=UPI00384C7D51
MALFLRSRALLYMILLTSFLSGFAHGQGQDRHGIPDGGDCQPAGNPGQFARGLPVTDASARADLLEYVCYYIAAPGTAGSRADAPAEIRGIAKWQPAEGRELVFSNSPATFWFTLNLHNPTQNAGVWYLKLSYAPLDHITFWVRGETLIQRLDTGDQTNFSSRAVDYRYFLVPVTLEAGQSINITMRLTSSGAINVPLSLEDPASMIAQSNHLTLTHGLFYGALLIFAVFNLLLFVSSWRSYYFYNSFYMTSMGLFLFAMGGFAFQYFWPFSPWLANTSIPLFEALGTLAMALFGRSFLEIDAAHRWLSRGLMVIAGISVLLLALVFLVPYNLAIKINTAFGLFTIAFLFFTGLLRWRQGYAPAKWYVMSWTLMVAGACIYALAAFGYLGDFMAQEILMQAAIGGQVILLNYAIVQRWRLLNEKLLAIEHDARHDLELKVHERTSQLRDTMRELERANIQLAELSTRDSLTGLHNRRYLDSTLTEMCAEARRNGCPVAMILLDADHFKAVNDTWGHAFGDECLQKIAGVLSRHVQRPRDMAARYGGEEFALVLPDTDAGGASKVAQRVLDDMSATGIVTPDGKAIHLSLSAGVGVLAPGENQRRLFARADKALYRAKALGRNRVEVAVSEEQQPADKNDPHVPS